MNCPPTLSYLSTHFFPPDHARLTPAQHLVMALKANKSNCLKARHHLCWGVLWDQGKSSTSPTFHAASIQVFTQAPPSAPQTHPAPLPGNTTLTLLLGQSCSKPITAHLRDHEMSNNGCGTLPWHLTLACRAIEALERSFAGDTREQSPIYFSLGMTAPAQKDTQAAL